MITQTKTNAKATLAAPKRLRRRLLKSLLIVLLVLVLLGGIALGVIGFYFSSQVLEVVHYLPTYTISVTDVSTHTITLERSFDTSHPGEFEIQWPGGAAIVGPVISSNNTAVTRQLLQMTAPLTRGTKVFWTRNVYSGQLKDSLGLTINDVQVPDSLGTMPALYVPGKLSTWVILVHGRGASREEALRVFPPLARLGLPLLAISYRNDVGAPASPDGFDHLGDTEWQDVDAAAHYAMAHGAQHLVIYGWSQGGAVVEAFVHHTSLASSIQALVLDAPVLNWRDTLSFQAQRRSLPGFFANVAELVATMRSGINFDALDQLSQSQPSTPMLLFQGADDTTTPPGVGDTFAQAHSSFVTYVRVPNTEHTEAWNTNPQTYDNQVSAFLTRILHL
ncbi:MAG TPA: alpha/beta fold hydrolase [Ktedonobacteraceae bacterium]